MIDAIAIFWYNDSRVDMWIPCFDQDDIDEHCAISRSARQIHWVEWL